MNISVLGGHGQIAMQLHPLLTKAGHKVRAIIRNETQQAAVALAGAKPVICDIEKVADLRDVLKESDAVVFTAGSGGKGIHRKFSMDRDGLLKTIAACGRLDIRRIIAISAMDAIDAPNEADRLRLKMDWAPDGRIFRNSAKPEGISQHEHIVHKSDYIQAKVEADRALRGSGLDYTIVRPGLLVNAPATGRVRVSTGRLPIGAISRGDVAALIHHVLSLEPSFRRELEAVGDDTSELQSSLNAALA